MPEKCKVVYFTTPSGRNPVKEFLESITEKQKAKVFRIFQVLKEYGLSSIIPHVKKLTGTPLWEIRILGESNIRIIYATIQKDFILVLHGFSKKTQKTPSKEIKIALKRHANWRQRYPLDNPKYH